MGACWCALACSARSLRTPIMMRAPLSKIEKRRFFHSPTKANSRRQQRALSAGGGTACGHTISHRRRSASLRPKRQTRRWGSAAATLDAPSAPPSTNRDTLSMRAFRKLTVVMACVRTFYQRYSRGGGRGDSPFPSQRASRASLAPTDEKTRAPPS